MAHVKTAVSMPASLYARLQHLSGTMKLSRSRLLAMALEDFLQRRENGDLLEGLNRAHASVNPEEESVRALRRRHHRRMAEREW